MLLTLATLLARRPTPWGFAPDVETDIDPGVWAFLARPENRDPRSLLLEAWKERFFPVPSTNTEDRRTLGYVGFLTVVKLGFRATRDPAKARDPAELEEILSSCPPPPWVAIQSLNPVEDLVGP